MKGITVQESSNTSYAKGGSQVSGVPPRNEFRRRYVAISGRKSQTVGLESGNVRPLPENIRIRLRKSLLESD